MNVNRRNTFTVLRPENRGSILVELSLGFIVNVNGRNTSTVLRPENRGNILVELTESGLYCDRKRKEHIYHFATRK